MTDLTNIKEIRDVCQEIADVYKNKMKDADYDPNGELMNFSWVVEYRGSLFELYFLLAPYWKYAENGRGPGKRPPIDAILKWVQHKRLATSTTGKARSTTQIAYAISWKIAREGTQGKHLLQRTIDETYNTLVDRLVELIADELDQDLEKDIEQVYD